jgi:drug/metabolite transporter (DMT)-like permease
MALLRRIFHWVNQQAWLALMLTTLMWGGNVVAGRAAVGEMSPLVLVCLRWLVAFAVIAAFARAEVLRDWPKLREPAQGRFRAPRFGVWPRVALMGALGFTSFNALFYVGAKHTTGVNLAILQGTVPIFVMAGAAVVFGQRFRLAQWAGLALGALGALLIAANGDLAHLAALSFNRGDVYCLIACLLFAVYSLALRDRPPVSPMALFAAMALAAFLTSLPLATYEIWSGAAYWPSLKGWALLAYIALGPSFLAQLLYMRGVALIGPARAGLYYNLTPIFGAALSALILGEVVHWFHVLALALVLGAIALSERGR